MLKCGAQGVRSGFQGKEVVGLKVGAVSTQEEQIQCSVADFVLEIKKVG